jgi:predicted lipoprotein with Yx(FWY)xxD motif
MKHFLPALTLSLAALSMAVAAEVPVKKGDNILVDKAGMTLYVFDKDVANSGKSACNGPCAENWPPLLAEEGATPEGKFSIITRDDGTKQWAHDGKPLYLYKADKQPGDREGDNFRDIWHVVKG